MYNDSTRDLHELCQIPVHCQYESLSDGLSTRETFADSLSFPVKSLFCMDTPVIIGKILHDHRVPVTVARLTLFVGNLVVCCCQVTKISARNMRQLELFSTCLTARLANKSLAWMWLELLSISGPRVPIWGLFVQYCELGETGPRRDHHQ